MRAFAGSLFLRLALLVVVTVLATQVFTLWLSVRQKHALLADQLYAQVIDTLADLEGSLDGMGPAGRRAFLRVYNREGFPQLLPGGAEKGPAFARRLPPLGQAVAERLSANLGEPVSVRWLRTGERQEMWVQVPLLGERYWLVMPMGRFLSPDFTPAMLAAAGVSLLAMLAAFGLAWRVTRPLTRLSDAARLLEAGGVPEPVPATGPREVRLLTERFNRMARALTDSARERRLMLAGLSHDLRTPLTRLKLALALQPDGGDKPDMLDDIDELSRIVQQFIDFARAEEGARLEPVALGDVAASVVGRFVREGMDVRLERQVEDERLADGLALERLLTNLIDNARRYGRAPFTVRLAKDGVDGVCLSVIDCGLGIPPEHREAALSPFERLTAHRGTDGGSGLGLAIVARIVRQHGGTLAFDDPPEGGFAVRVCLPGHVPPR